MKNYKIAVAGTGYVGLSLGVLFAQHHQVVAVDIVQAKVDMINNKKSPIQDDYIEKYLAEKDLNLTATLDAKAAYFPPICDMDRLNRKGYAMIAEEFTEKKRVTTHNFHTLSADFFQDSINKFVYQGCKVLEVGPGRGWMRKTCSWPVVTYDVLELTEEMARFLDVLMLQ